MNKYEFVTKKEYAPIRDEIVGIIRKVQKNLRKKDSDMTFQFRLVGSGGRNLVTKIKGGNAGYDLDFNLILNNNYEWDADVREDFFKAIQKEIKTTRFNKIENSTSVITIKQVNKKNSEIIVSCDFSIVYYPEDDESNYYIYARLNKNNNKFEWAVRDVSRFSDDKLRWLKGKNKDVWNQIKEEYIKLKEHDNEDKHSFILYYEAINNTYNHYKQEEKKEKERQNYITPRW